MKTNYRTAADMTRGCKKEFREIQCHLDEVDMTWNDWARAVIQRAIESEKNYQPR